MPRNASFLLFCFGVSVWVALSTADARNKPFQTQVATAPPSPVHLTSEQDRQRIMDLLHITSLRRGPDADPKSPYATNFEESKVPPYPLPDPLRLNNGEAVKSAEMWWKQRRPEIVELFDREIYGRVPPSTPAVRWEVVSTTQDDSAGIPVVTKKLLGHV